VRLSRRLRRWWNGISYRSIISVIRDLPRWLFLGTLIYVPWDYGGTTETSIVRINLLLGTVLGLWLIELAVRRRGLEIANILLIAAAAILVLGWLMTWNSRAVFDGEFGVFVPVQKRLGFAPSSIDATISAVWMGRASLLVASIIFIADLSQRPQWLLRIWIAIGIAGGSIALLGLLQRATGAVLPFWEYRLNEQSSFFATYYYHANAGAFLNLVLPPTAGLALRAFQRRLPVQRAIWSTATLLLVVAIITNTSRVAQLLGTLTLLALALGPARRALWHATRTNLMAVTFAIVGAALIFFAVAQAKSTYNMAERWRRTLEEITKDPRWDAVRVAAEAVPDAGWFGFGPGTFSVIFPYYERVQKAKDPGGWSFLHEDYLQTLLEWGWAGVAGWAVIFLGGIATGIRVLARLRKRKPKPAPRFYRILPLVLIALSTIALHSLVDFPLQITSLQLYAATYLGICWGSRKLLAGN
jgi:O-Antigen ligase